MQLYDEIKKWATLDPERIAFFSKNGSLTYQQLHQNSNALSFYIEKQAVDENSPIIVYGHMEPEMLVCFLSCVKTGHPYIPIDTSIPDERVIQIIKDSKAAILFAVAETSKTIIDLEIKIIDKEAIKVITENTPVKKFSFNHSVKGDDDFYIIYTSGSTGNPKGVQISYNNLASFTNWAINHFSLKEQQVFLNQAPFSFDLSVMDLYPCLMTGGTLWAIEKELIGNYKLLFASFKQSGMNIWTSTPSFADMCLVDSQFSDEMLPNLNTFLFCGEVLSIETARKLHERFPNAKIFNTYGPTEATVCVTSILVDEIVLNHYSSLPVGYCKNDCEILIIGENGEILSEGEKGEVVIVGNSVGKGYLRNPHMTARSFFIMNGKRAYKTGDSGYLKNELLFFSGRLDFQVKVNGFRMEIEEIEHHLRSIPFVEKAIVLPIYKDGKCQHLTSIVVPSHHMFEKEYQLTSAIKKELKKTLPVYMIPKKFVYLSDFPMTHNGKVDRKTLLLEVTK